MPSSPNSANQRTFAVNVELRTPEGAVFEIGLTLAEETTFAELEESLRRSYQVPGSAHLAGTLRFPGPRNEEELGFYPPEARVSDAGILEGDRLTFTSHARNEAFWYSQREVIEQTSLFLIDSTGSAKGRVVPLPRQEEVVFGSAPSGGKHHVYLDDGLVHHNAFSITADDADRAVEVRRIGTARVRVNGREIETASMLPGATIELLVDVANEDPRAIVPVRTILFQLVEDDDVSGRNPQGRVRLEPSARRSSPRFGRLTTRSLPNRPSQNPTRAFRWEQIALPLVGVGIIATITGNIANSAAFLVLAIIQPVVYIVGYVRDSRENKNKYRTSLIDWRREVDRAITDLASLAEHEAQGRSELHKPITTWINRALRRGPELWERRSEDPDFMGVRIGRADSISGLVSELDYRNVASDANEQKTIDERVARAGHLADVPVALSLASENIALVGEQQFVNSLASSVVLQLCMQCSPRDLALAAFMPRDADMSSTFEWIKWLPHFQSASMLLPDSHYAAGRQASAELLGAIAERLEERNLFRADSKSARAVLIVHEAAEVDHSKLREVVDRSASLVHVLWIGSGQTNRPIIIDTTVTILDYERAAVESRIAGNEWDSSQLLWEGVGEDRAKFVAQRLAPLYDPLALGSSGGIPPEVALSSVVDVLDSESIRDVASSLAIPLGIDERGIFELDLVADGPHLLIGGTTGAGKSALLQTLLASLAVRYSADQVNFILVDYKGGATFAAFKDLPHTVGFVSDLNASDVVRVLDFTREEMQKRARLFDSTRDSDGNPVKDYEEYNAANGSASLPRLIVVFDEFAALLEQQGKLKLMERVEDLAQRGRSWGIHLVLATQQPSGQVVSTRIRANVGIRIALRTIDAANSETIIDSPEAASIPKSLSGRAIVRMSAGKLQAFQAAFAGSSALSERLQSPTTRVQIRPYKLDSGPAQW